MSLPGKSVWHGMLVKWLEPFDVAFCASWADLCNNENAMWATVKPQTLFLKVIANYWVIDYHAGHHISHKVFRSALVEICPLPLLGRVNICAVKKMRKWLDSLTPSQLPLYKLVIFPLPQQRISASADSMIAEKKSAVLMLNMEKDEQVDSSTYN